MWSQGDFLVFIDIDGGEKKTKSSKEGAPAGRRESKLLDQVKGKHPESLLSHRSVHMLSSDSNIIDL